MNKTTLYCVFAPALAVLSIMHQLSAADNTDKARHTIIAVSGEPAPSGGNYISFSFGNVTFNARQAVAFDAFLTGPPVTSAAFVRDGRTTSAVAFGVNPNPAGPSFGSVSDPFVTANGSVLFTAGAADIFRGDGKTIAPVVKAGDPAPGGGMVSVLGLHVVNDDGAVAYFAGVSGAAANQAIFRTDGTRTVTIARDDVAPPTGGRFTALENFDINKSGQVTFNAEMTGGTADHGVFRGEGDVLTPLFVTNQAAPGGGTIDDCGDPKINIHGQVMAICSLTSTASSKGVFIGDGRDAVAIALLGHSAPKGGNYAVFTSSPRLNDHGEVVFQALLTNGGSGMFRGDGKRTTTIALSGTNAPGTTGTFQSFGEIFTLGNDSRVVFAARLATGEGGVDSTNNVGIWIGSSDEDLRLLARAGDVIGGRVLTALPLEGSSAAGHALQMNENSILWRGSFGSAKAVIVTDTSGESGTGKED